jgi:hypothetical protein
VGISLMGVVRRIGHGGKGRRTEMVGADRK